MDQDVPCFTGVGAVCPGSLAPDPAVAAAISPAAPAEETTAADGLASFAHLPTYSPAEQEPEGQEGEDEFPRQAAAAVPCAAASRSSRGDGTRVLRPEGRTADRAHRDRLNLTPLHLRRRRAISEERS
jgi:hypothetical protein